MKRICAFIGKFYPPHIGHLSVIDNLIDKFDEVYVIISKNDIRNRKIYERSGFKILDADIIKQWFEKHYEKEKKVKVAVFDESGLKPYPEDVDKWAEKFKIEFPTVNVKVADESYRAYNEKYFPDYEFYPIEREEINIHSTDIRNNIEKNINYAIPEAREYLLKSKEKEMEKNIEIDHVDIVTSHICNKNCQFCVDKFLHSYNKIIDLKDIDKFLKMIKKITDNKVTVLLLGGEPTVLPTKNLIEIANLIHSYGYIAVMSTNGVLKKKIIELVPYYDWIQVTVYKDEEIDFYRDYRDKVNIKYCGDENLTLEKLNHFIEYTEGFERRSVTMYFTVDGQELCKDERVWQILETLEWSRNGSYMYAFYKGVRFKKSIPGVSNIIDEPTIPKLYPNGNYNKSWNNEDLDDYLSDNEWNKL